MASSTYLVVSPKFLSETLDTTVLPPEGEGAHTHWVFTVCVDLHVGDVVWVEHITTGESLKDRMGLTKVPLW